MPNKKLCSIIIRTKNEERWIGSCLKAVYGQKYDNFEVIIVDNKSSDRTLKKTGEFPIDKVVTIDEYFPGKALNAGIKVSKGEYIVCLSGHCIPVNEQWLGSLVTALEQDPIFAGAYGRQESMAFSTAADKRDMLVVFGLDRRIQKKDSFFHNANSIIRRELWEEQPFDDGVTNIEDRIWAQEILNRGHSLIYEPEASVYHYHGIHQDGDEERLTNVLKIIEQRGISNERGIIDAEQLEVIALIPVSRHGKRKSKEEWSINGIPQFSYTIEAAIDSKYIKQIIVTTDDEESAAIARKLGAKCPFTRPSSLSQGYVSLETVQKYSLEKIEELGIYPDLVVHLEETFPFRQPGMIDKMIEYLLQEGFDSVIASRKEFGFLWQEDGNGNYVRLDSGDVPREFKEKSYVGLHGLGIVTHPVFIRQERMLGNKVGLYTIDSPLAGFEVRDKESRKIAATLLNNT